MPLRVPRLLSGGEEPAGLDYAVFKLRSRWKSIRTGISDAIDSESLRSENSSKDIYLH
jgi:hypothetical protein